MEFRDLKLCTLEGVVFNSCAIQSSPRPSSTQRRIFDACGFRATLLVPTAPCSLDKPSFIVHMYHFLLPDARCVEEIGGSAYGLEVYLHRVLNLAGVAAGHRDGDRYAPLAAGLEHEAVTLCEALLAH